MLKHLVLAAAFSTAGCAAALAQSGSSFPATFEADGSARFDWPAIEACAREPLKAPRPDTPEGALPATAQSMAASKSFYRINACRFALAARHDGWRAAGGASADPFPAQPLKGPDDFKARWK